MYPKDADYKKSLNNHFNYFNTTTWMANILIGASLAMEEQDGIQAIDTVQNFKTRLMGPLAGIGDTLIWVLYLLLWTRSRLIWDCKGIPLAQSFG